MALLQHNQLNILKISVTYIDKLNKQSKKVNYAPKSIFGTSFVLNGLRYTHTPKSIETLSALNQFFLIFKKYPSATLLNDAKFITAFKHAFEKNPKMVQREFQLFVSAFLNKRKFNLNDCIIGMGFNNAEEKVSILPAFQNLPIVTDHSTLFTFLQTYIFRHIAKFTSSEMIIYPTINAIFKEKLSPEDLKKYLLFKRYTGNVCPDGQIYNQAYDFKNGDPDKFFKNHIYFVNEDVLNSKVGAAYLRNIVRSFDNEINLCRQKNSLFDLQSLEKYKNFIEDLIKTRDLSPVHKFKLLLEFRLKQLSSGTDTIPLPLFVPMPNTYNNDVSIVDMLKEPLPLFNKGLIAVTSARELALDMGSTFLSNEQKQVFWESTGWSMDN